MLYWRHSKTLIRCLHGTEVLVDGDDHGNATAEENFRVARIFPPSKRDPQDQLKDFEL